MGPLRETWTFPYNAVELMEAAIKERDRLARLLDQHEDEEAAQRRFIEEQRELLRSAGVKNANSIRIEVPSARYGGDPAWTRRKMVNDVADLERWVRYFTRMRDKDPHRSFKLTKSDMEYFGL